MILSVLLRSSAASSPLRIEPHGLFCHGGYPGAAHKEGAGLYCEKMDPVVVPTPDWFRPELGMGGALALDRDAMNAYAYHVLARVKP